MSKPRLVYDFCYHQVGGHDPRTDCCVCGGRRHAYSHPPVCGDACLRELDLEIEYNRCAAQEAAEARAA